MVAKYAYGKRAIGECDICAQTYRLQRLKEVIRKGSPTDLLACPTCWDKDQPQLRVGEYEVSDPQALKNPRPDTASLAASRGFVVPLTQVSAVVSIGGVTVTII